MRTKACLFLAKLMIGFSLILIVLGVFLVVSNGNNILHPIEDVFMAEADKDKVSITTITDDENEKLIETSEKVENIDTTETLSDTNKKLRKLIQNTYGVFVKYGKETAGYSIGGMNTTVIEDDLVIYTALTNLNKSLALYPKGFFQELSTNGFPVTFNLIKRFSKDNVTGVTDSTREHVIISIAVDYDFSNTFHHEVYHYIEKYTLSTGFSFTSWSSLNPSGFVYGNVINDYSYASTFSEDSFFVNIYAMTDEFEDRASTFEYMMKDNKASCFNYGKTVWLKARAMSEHLDYFFNTVSPKVTEYWERHVY